ncbi:MAG: hypothetical protein C4518_04525 [Desulfobacteraceae bacterium]|nr:MAG: hypothetical protein C4518_04525 [Desulfobacteraceae bacterium]
MVQTKIAFNVRNDARKNIGVKNIAEKAVLIKKYFHNLHSREWIGAVNGLVPGRDRRQQHPQGQIKRK